MVVLFACPALAQDQEKDFSDISKIIDAKLVFALAEESAKSCPDLMFGDQELVKRYTREIVAEDGRINSRWFVDMTDQSHILNTGIRSIVGLPPKDGNGRFEVHYDSGMTRIISISREGKITCENGSVLLKK